MNFSTLIENKVEILKEVFIAAFMLKYWMPPWAIEEILNLSY